MDITIPIYQIKYNKMDIIKPIYQIQYIIKLKFYIKRISIKEFKNVWLNIWFPPSDYENNQLFHNYLCNIISLLLLYYIIMKK